MTVFIDQLRLHARDFLLFRRPENSRSTMVIVNDRRGRSGRIDDDGDPAI